MGNHSVKGVIKRGDIENVKQFFTECPEQKTHQDRFGWTAPHVAIRYHKLDVLKYLLEDLEGEGKGGMDANHVDNEGSTLLHHALYYTEEHFDLVVYLLDSGKQAFSVVKDHHGNNPLHVAFRVCSLKQIEQMLVYFKGHKDAFSDTNKEEKTPLDLLKDRVKGSEESLKIVEELQKHIEAKLENGSKPGSKVGSVQGTPHGSPRSSVHLEHAPAGTATPGHKTSHESPAAKEKSGTHPVPEPVKKSSKEEKEPEEGKVEEPLRTSSSSDNMGISSSEEDNSDAHKKDHHHHHHHHHHHKKDHHHHHHHKKESSEEESSHKDSKGNRASNKKKHSSDGDEEKKKSSSDEDKKH